MIDRVYVVHMPDPERRALMDRELAKMGFEAEYLAADRPRGPFNITNMRRNARAEFGASLSHVKCLVKAIADGAQCPLFLEDDVEFLCARDRLDAAMRELPADWDILYLGGHPRGPTKAHSQSLVKVGEFSFAESYAMSRKALRPFLDFWLDRIGKPTAMYDIILGEFAAANQGYCVYPTVTRQWNIKSHISGEIDDKKSLLVKGWATHKP